jgi:type IV pilus assembly protein PilM
MKNLFGLDFGSSTYKVVKLEDQAEKIRLASLGVIQAPSPGIESDSDNDLKQVVEAIKKVKTDAKIPTSQVALALPESKVYTRVIEMPSLTDEELSSAMEWEAEQYIPIPLSEVNLDWQVLARPGKGFEEKKMEVLLVAAPKALIRKYSKVAEEAGLEIMSLESEIIAISRAVVGEEEVAKVVLNLGGRSTDIAIVRSGQVVFTRSIGTGGVSISRAVASTLNLDLAQAEEYKKAYGFLENQLEGKVRGAIVPIFNVIVSEIKKAIDYYVTKASDNKLGSIVVSGGTALLPGAIAYLAENLGIEVLVANPFAKMLMDERSEKLLSASAPLYAVAVGLAMKEV